MHRADELRNAESLQQGELHVLRGELVQLEGRYTPHGDAAQRSVVHPFDQNLTNSAIHSAPARHSTGKNVVAGLAGNPRRLIWSRMINSSTARLPSSLWSAGTHGYAVWVLRMSIEDQVTRPPMPEWILVARPGTLTPQPTTASSFPAMIHSERSPLFSPSSFIRKKETT